jgi:hypothetical protein
VDTLAGWVCTTIDGVATVSASPVLGHSSTRCSGRAHTMKKLDERKERCVR